MATGVPTSALTEGPSGDGPDPLRSDSRLRASVTVAAVMVWTLFAVLVTYGRFDVVHPETFGNFYDAQARALLDGRLAVDPNQVGFEGFQMDGATHIYQGLVPTIGRLPVMVVTDRLDGRLTSLSMLAAMAVALGHVAVLVLVARRLVRGPAPVGRGEVVALGATVAAAGGSSLLFLGSWRSRWPPEPICCGGSSEDDWVGRTWRRSSGPGGSPCSPCTADSPRGSAHSCRSASWV